MNDTRSHRWFHFITQVLITSWVLLLCVSTTWAGDACSDSSCDSRLEVREGDAIWLLNSRSIYCDCDDDCSLEKLKVHRHVAADTWSSSSLEKFLTEDDPAINTVIWIHGNRVDPWMARQRGLAMYGALSRQATDDRPIRYVIWSWPSTQIRGIRNDVMVKAYRSDFEGLAVAEVLGRLHPQTSVGMMGFSFGARIISGAMHVSAGGQLGSYRLAKRNEQPRKPYHAVFMAAALDDDWLLPNRYHGLAVSQASQMLLLNNSCDSVLRRYHMIDRCTRPCALGYWGLASPNRLGEQKDKILQHNVSYLLGSEHHGPSYIYTPKIMQMARQALVFD